MGSKSQESADEIEMTELSSSSDCDVSCDDHEPAKLKVFVVRAGSDKGIEDLSVKASGQADLSPQKSKGEEGVADFGEVEPGSYEIEVELTAEDKEKYSQPRPKRVLTRDGHLTKAFVPVCPFASLRLVLLGYDAANGRDVELGDLDWEMTKPVAETGKTKPDGLIDIQIGGDVFDAQLSVTVKPAAAAVPPPDPDVARDETAYPPKIQPQLYKDEDAKPVIPPREALVVKWSLDILPPEAVEGEPAARGRLHNLGFACDANSDAKTTERAVRAYQLLYESDREGSGTLKDIEADLSDRHDKA